MVPPKLKAGDHVRVIAPAHSFSPQFTKAMRRKAVERFNQLGLTVSYGKYVDERNDFNTTTIEHRLEDLDDAISDPTVQAIIPAMGGSSANQLLKYIDYDQIKNNPKILCGLSDITDFANAVYAKTGLVTYYGPHFTMVGASRIVDHSLESMKKTFFSDETVTIYPSDYYSNSEWDREMIVNEGLWAINEGEVEAKSIGGNLLTINLSLGSEYFTDFEGSILFFEENEIIDYRGVQKQLQAVLNQPDGGELKGLIIGRFQKGTEMTRDLLSKIIKSKKELEGVPVVGNVDLGHTAPMVTFPIGGAIKLEVKKNDEVRIDITEH